MSDGKIYPLVIIGRLGADPELHEGKEGRKFATFNLAVNGIPDYNTGNSQPIWWKCLPIGEVHSKLTASTLKKGMHVTCHGYPHKTKIFERKDGDQDFNFAMLVGKIIVTPKNNDDEAFIQTVLPEKSQDPEPDK